MALENPADRADDTSPAYWEAYADRASIWRLQTVSDALAAAGAAPFTFAQCAPAIGGAAQKWTTIAASRELRHTLAGLADCLCPHGAERHDEVLEGVNAAGQWRATAAAAYPEGLDRLLASGLVAAATARRAAQDADFGGGDDAVPCEGRVADGPALCPAVALACEAARDLPPRFASMRHLDAAPRAELWREPLPGGVQAPPRASRPASACKARRRRPLPRGGTCCPPSGRGQQQQRAAGGAPPSRSSGDPTAPEAGAAVPRPAGPIPIAALFLGDVYQAEVQSWFLLADAAVAALQRGEAPPRVPTRTIGQEQLQPWARGIIWDCRDATDCRPVERSTRETVFTGKQLDRAAFRRAAALLDWQDHDIVDQAGEGGVEPRSDCELLIVLAFHHDSLVQEVGAATKAVERFLEEGWAEPARRHLPFVPCRLQPRGVVQQSRTRVLDDGTCEDYLKPRITTDSSFGGVDSINAGLPDAEREVGLPSGQSFGRGWSICQSAFDDAPTAEGGGTAVGGYCIDAESAYNYLVIQRADWWTQCYVWWGTDGRAGTVVDQRMGFGGGFAPNRFERVSTLAGAYAQRRQRQFDVEQPPPICAQRWSADRVALQQQGTLPEGPAQTEPRFMQVFIDDFTGAAACDRVRPPPEVTGVALDDDGLRAMGGEPAARDTRVYVHAQLLVLALQELGFSVAPGKAVCGRSMIALGLFFDGPRRRICCPSAKLAAIKAACSTAVQEAAATSRVDCARARRLVGRLCNLSQIAPELRPLLRGGYAVCGVDSHSRSRGVTSLKLGADSAARRGWLALLQAAPGLVDACRSAGVAMAPRRRFPGRAGVGAATVVTDASGDDGCGGFAFVAGRPKLVALVAAEWPPDVRAALAAGASEEEAALRRAGSPAAAWLAMPAAELFTALMVTALVRRSFGAAEVQRAFLVGDCAPAVAATNSLHSTRVVMRHLLAQPIAHECSLLGVHVKRELNQDADRLSHPADAALVAAEAEAADLEVVWLEPEEADWAPLRAAITEGDVASRRRKRRRRAGAGGQ